MTHFYPGEGSREEEQDEYAVYAAVQAVCAHMQSTQQHREHFPETAEREEHYRLQVLRQALNEDSVNPDYALITSLTPWEAFICALQVPNSTQQLETEEGPLLGLDGIMLNTPRRFAEQLQLAGVPPPYEQAPRLEQVVVIGEHHAGTGYEIDVLDHIRATLPPEKQFNITVVAPNTLTAFHTLSSVDLQFHEKTWIQWISGISVLRDDFFDGAISTDFHNPDLSEEVKRILKNPEQYGRVPLPTNGI